MKQHAPKSADWDICPPGLLHEAAAVGNPVSWWPIALLATAVFAVMIAVMFQLQSSPEPAPVTSRTCTLVRQQMVDYVVRNITDCGTRKRLGCHICRCPDCRKVFNQTVSLYAGKERPTKVLVNPRLPCEGP